MNQLSLLFSGLLFGAGLVLSGMTDPAKVIGFLDVGGAWDPSLAFVMGGAVLVHATGRRLMRGARTPWFTGDFSAPLRTHIDRALVIGSALFGVGWALAGYCPGPALVALGSGSIGAISFVAFMLLGMLLYQVMHRRWGQRSPSRPGSEPPEADPLTLELDA